MNRRGKTAVNKPAVHSSCEAIRKHGLPFLIFFFAAFFMFHNLDGRLLWQDEAQTALIAKTVIQKGLPHGTDGVHSFSQDAGAEYGDNHLWRYHPWLQFYLAAASVKVLGESDFAFRFPFAFFGFLTVVFVYFMTLKLTGCRRTAVFAAFAAAFSAALILLSRQCRYYSLAIFFSVAAIFFYSASVSEGKNRYRAMLCASMLILFHSMYLNFFILLSALALHQAVFTGFKDKKTTAALFLPLLLSLPFMFFLYGTGQELILTPALYRNAFVAYGDYILKYLFPFFMIPAAAAAYMIYAGKKGEPRRKISPLTGVCVLFAAVSVFILPVFSGVSFAYRNLACIIIPLAYLSGVTASVLFGKNKILGAAVILALIFSGPLTGVVAGIVRTPAESARCAVEYLNANSNDKETLLVTYPDLPFKHYTNLRVFGGLTGGPAEESGEPDYIIIKEIKLTEMERASARYVAENLDPANYVKITLPCPDKYWENREDLVNHDYDNGENLPQLVIYRKIKKGQQ